MKPTIEYLPDLSIDAATDEMLRGLLVTCFTKPQDVVFRDQRYFRQPYQDRWVIRDEGGALVAHIGVHDKKVAADGQAYCIGGIAEVCVHPDHRGRGYVRMMLACIHEWLSGRGYPFSVLFGAPGVYGSSGYAPCKLVHGGEAEGWKEAGAMVKELSATAWPSGTVRLPGPTF